GELGTPPSRITGNHSTVSSIVMASLALLMQEGRGEPAVHPPEPPCLDEEIAAQSPYGAPDAQAREQCRVQDIRKSEKPLRATAGALGDLFVKRRAPLLPEDRSQHKEHFYRHSRQGQSRGGSQALAA
ncbi:MAG: hypothetical protein ACO3U5_04395, partial [Aquiluna sp.]